MTNPKVIGCNYFNCTYNTMKCCTRPEIFIAATGHCGMMQDNQEAANRGSDKPATMKSARTYPTEPSGRKSLKKLRSLVDNANYLVDHKINKEYY
jgi:hypothetical protein